MVKLPAVHVSRQAEIVTRFKQVLDSHLDDFLAGRVAKLYELKELAALVYLHPVHLSQVLKRETGHHACYFYEQRMVLEAKRLLAATALPIGIIAHKLDYDVSNFTKFFKRFTGMTPSAYRKSILTSPENER